MPRIDMREKKILISAWPGGGRELPVDGDDLLGYRGQVWAGDGRRIAERAGTVPGRATKAAWHLAAMALAMSPSARPPGAPRRWVRRSVPRRRGRPAARA